MTWCSSARKVRQSGIWKAVDGRVLIFIHKEEMLATVEREFPATRYVLIDDKERILDAVKAVWGDKVVSVFPRQGHYAFDPANAGGRPQAGRDGRDDRRPVGR